MAVRVQCELSSVRARRLSRVLERRAEKMLEALRLPDAELSVVVCGDAAMRKLNASYRGLDRATDVLAFAQGEAMTVPSASHRVLGDIVLSVPTADRQAKAKGRDLHDEATMLLAHGLLHLLGIDHRTKTEWRRMQARTDFLRMAAQALAAPVGNPSRAPFTPSARHLAGLKSPK